MPAARVACWLWWAAALRAVVPGVQLYDGDGRALVPRVVQQVLARDPGARIAAILDSNASLTDLTLDSNGLTGASGEAIFRALGANMGLKALSLARNPIGVSDSELTD